MKIRSLVMFALAVAILCLGCSRSTDMYVVRPKHGRGVGLKEGHSALIVVVPGNIDWEGGEAVVVVKDAATGAIVYEKSQYMENLEKYSHVVAGLRPGCYAATLERDGRVWAGWYFSVNPASPYRYWDKGEWLTPGSPEEPNPQDGPECNGGTE